MWKLHCPCSQFLAGKLGPNFGGVGNNWIFCGPPAVSSFTINHVQSNCVVGSTRYVKQSEIPINDSMVDWYPDLRIYVIFFFFFTLIRFILGTILVFLLLLSIFVLSSNIAVLCCALICLHCAVSALQDLYRTLNNPPGLKGWRVDGGDPCEESWTGVSCSDSSVIHL